MVLTGFSSGRNRTGAPSPPVVSGSMAELLLNSNKTASYLQGPISTSLIPILYILILAVGVPANLFTLCSLASKVHKVSSAILYCTLALSNLLLLLSLVFRAHYHLRGNQSLFGETACRMVSACFYGNLYCSAQTLASISVKRYLAVVHPFKSLPKRMAKGEIQFVNWTKVYLVKYISQLIHAASSVLKKQN